MFYGIAEFTTLPSGVNTYLVVSKYETWAAMYQALQVVTFARYLKECAGDTSMPTSRGARFYNGVWHAEY
jgi:hypothetical protein